MCDTRTGNEMCTGWAGAGRCRRETGEGEWDGLEQPSRNPKTNFLKQFPAFQQGLSLVLLFGDFRLQPSENLCLIYFHPRIKRGRAIQVHIKIGKRETLGTSPPSSPPALPIPLQYFHDNPIILYPFSLLLLLKCIRPISFPNLPFSLSISRFALSADDGKQMD